MKNLIALFLLPFCCIHAQNNKIEGKIIYDMEIFGRKTVASLDFSSNSSLYYIIKNQKDAYELIQEGDLIKTFEVDTTNTYIYTDRVLDSLYLKQPYSFGGREARFRYLYEPLPELNWEVFGEVKNILNIRCRKAKATFRGRVYTAWYAISIPAYFGPWKLSGLPGLILEVTDDKSVVSFKAKKIVIPNKFKKFRLETTLKKVRLDTTYLSNQRKQRNLFLKKINARADRGGIKTSMKRETLELNFDDVKY